jgi:hypothetical protein
VTGKKRNRLRRAAVALSVLFLVGTAASVPCAAITASLAWSQVLFRPTTVGLPVGAAAPAVDGVTWLGKRSVLLVAEVSPNPLQFAAAEWSHIAGLQVVVTLPVGSDFELSRLGPDVTLLTESVAAVKRSFWVGSDQSVIFLIDETGTIVYRNWNPSERHIARLDPIIRDFAALGRLPANLETEHPLWFGDVAPPPSFPLEALDGSPIWLESGRARLFFCGSALSAGLSAEARRALDILRAEFPSVDFVWLQPYAAHDLRGAIWDVATRFGWVVRGPLAQPLDAYLAASDAAEVAWRNTLRDMALEDATGWTMLLDPDYRLQTLWLLYGVPSVFVLDAEGRVALPCTFVVGELTNGVFSIPSASVDSMRRVLGQVSS